MYSFTYRGHSVRVLFGSGTVRELGNELERLGMKRALFLTTPGQEDYVRKCAQAVGPVAVGVFANATMHTPVSVTEEALSVVRERRVDGVVAIGGGSTIGLGKAIAWRTDLPQVVIPTTYAGSEMTPILGETADGQKVTRSDPRILPETVIYDVELTTTLPREAAVASGINAMAHAVEALYAEDRNPVVDLIAVDAISALYDSLPYLAESQKAAESSEKALYGAWLGGICLGSVSMALHHKLCHTLGGMFDLPHAELHAALLPHTLAYNGPAIPYVIDKLGKVFKQHDPAQSLFEFNQQLRVRAALAELGMPKDGIEPAVAAVLAKPCRNPRPLEREALIKLLKRAYAGAHPAP
ncbi:maleylacetate reductase (plasmid) [Rhizobium sp. 11515TR]|uniref:maleylacetate reductase n=2 Tax=Rhizobium sp. 11515TR TaxID=2028343 RepID=UPI000BA8450C|nr:maleylacetate reductase [Rhizobium sp. 11515TR]ASW08590.1 maleylacetate reductase [Rhizobium sp. 11515TR]